MCLSVTSEVELHHETHPLILFSALAQCGHQCTSLQQSKWTRLNLFSTAALQLVLCSLTWMQSRWPNLFLRSIKNTWAELQVSDLLLVMTNFINPHQKVGLGKLHIDSDAAVTFHCYVTPQHVVEQGVIRRTLGFMGDWSTNWSTAALLPHILNHNHMTAAE